MSHSPLGYKRRVAMVRFKIALALAGLTVLGGRAHAEPSEMSTEAKKHFDRGLELYNVELYEYAIVEFKAAQQADPQSWSNRSGRLQPGLCFRAPRHSPVPVFAHGLSADPLPARAHAALAERLRRLRPTSGTPACR